MTSLDDTIRTVLDADATTYRLPAGLGEAAVRRGRRIRRTRAAVATGTLGIAVLALAATVVGLGRGGTAPTAGWSRVRYLGARPDRLIASIDANDRAAGMTHRPLLAGTLPNGHEFYAYLTSLPDRRDLLVRAWGRDGHRETDSAVTLDQPLGSMPDVYVFEPAARQGGTWVLRDYWLVVAGRVGTVRLTYTLDPAMPERDIPSTDGVGAIKVSLGAAPRIRGYAADGRKVFDRTVNGGSPESVSPLSRSRR